MWLLGRFVASLGGAWLIPEILFTVVMHGIFFLDSSVGVRKSLF